MIIFNSIILSSSLLSYETSIDNKQVFYFDGDYSQVAKEYYNKEDNQRNDSSILYDIIAKEIQEGKHKLD